MVVHWQKIRLGEEGIRADASLLATTLLQEHKGVERVSGCWILATNSDEEI